MLTSLFGYLDDNCITLKNATVKLFGVWETEVGQQIINQPTKK
jgi:hypothetical protein